ncbi:unnamed protein product, partial [Callosobruchus maculatus]
KNVWHKTRNTGTKQKEITVNVKRTPKEDYEYGSKKYNNNFLKTVELKLTACVSDMSGHCCLSGNQGN